MKDTWHVEWIARLMLIGGRESRAVASASMGRGPGKRTGEQHPSFLAHPLAHIWGPEILGLGFHVLGALRGQPGSEDSGLEAAARGWRSNPWAEALGWGRGTFPSLALCPDPSAG